MLLGTTRTSVPCITWSERTRASLFAGAASSPSTVSGLDVDAGLLRRTLFLVKRVFRCGNDPGRSTRIAPVQPYIAVASGLSGQPLEDYHRTLRKVAMVFQGRSDELQRLLSEQMDRYAERLDFEAAARVRDQLQGLDQLTADQKMSLPDSSVSRDVVALASDERLAAVQLFQMRAGKLVGRLGYMADADGLDPGLILQRVIEEHYSQVDAVEIRRNCWFSIRCRSSSCWRSG